MDTFLSPFIKEDNLCYQDVKQDLQNFIFSINSNSRGGAEPAFSNITLDITPPKDLVNTNVSFGGGTLGYTYKECQKEMDMFNKAFYELMLEGDSDGKPMSYPIPTYNIHDRFDWDNPNNDPLFEMAGRYGYPYFANFLNSDMEPEEARSMCCRLRLSLRDLERKNGGLFGAGEATGSVGVVTLNLPRYGYIAKTKEELLSMIKDNMVVAKDSLEIKRKWLQTHIIDTNLVPAFNTYVGTMDNHFSTIGMVGMNEMCENFLGKDILAEESVALCVEVLDYMRNVLSDFQEETGNLYNLEATPAESTAYRMAKNDLQIYPDIITQGTKEAPYYTNSCHIPVSKVETVMQMSEHQNRLQDKYTGGTVEHIYFNAGISGKHAKHIIRTCCETYSLPYLSISPITRSCPHHGDIQGVYDECPICGEELDMYQRITGYIRNTKNYNVGKKQEFKERKQL